MPDRPHSARPDNAVTWIADVVRARGFFGALRSYGSGFLELLRDLTPVRRKSRYGDIDFDFEHGVDTSWATVSLRTRIREWLRGVQYQASEPGLFREIISSLPVPFEGYSFLDLGSGKGRTLLMASSYPFRRIVGLELLPELNDIAVKNLASYKNDEQRCFAIESHAGDARAFDFPADPAVLYLFNPFPRYVLEVVLTNLRLSLLRQPRPMYVIYHNLVHEDLFDEQSWLRQIHGTHQYAVYETGARGQGSGTRVGD